MRQAAQKHLAGLLDVENAAAGMRTIAWIKTGGPDTVLAARARDRGLELSSLSTFSVRHYHPPALVLGFAGSSPSELRRGIGVLAAALT